MGAHLSSLCTTGMGSNLDAAKRRLGSVKFCPTSVGFIVLQAWQRIYTEHNHYQQGWWHNKVIRQLLLLPSTPIDPMNLGNCQLATPDFKILPRFKPMTASPSAPKCSHLCTLRPNCCLTSGPKRSQVSFIQNLPFLTIMILKQQKRLKLSAISHEIFELKIAGSRSKNKFQARSYSSNRREVLKLMISSFSS